MVEFRTLLPVIVAPAVIIYKHFGYHNQVTVSVNSSNEHNHMKIQFR